MHLKQNANNSLKLESHTDAMTKIIGYECYDDVLYAVDKKGNLTPATFSKSPLRSL